jgi:hypothetical protein
VIFVLIVVVMVVSKVLKPSFFFFGDAPWWLGPIYTPKKKNLSKLYTFILKIKPSKLWTSSTYNLIGFPN